MSYAFVFDASACSGCKACQIACKDKNHLPVGVLWRRVVEVSGGTWHQLGNAWATDVFAYNLTIACNHCGHPKCAGVCPADAFVVREDGIVYIDGSKCMGCGYCNWACPYGVPQFNPELGYMTKCNFCMDNIDAGLPPACVAACPLRVLDYVDIKSSLPSAAGKRLWEGPASEHPYPLPQYSRTEPRLVIKPHAGMLNELAKAVSNREETRPPGEKFKLRSPWPSIISEYRELPLVAFTLLGQMAAGMAALSFISGLFSTQIHVTVGVLFVLAGLTSLLHLGSPSRAWRALAHLKKSWLSREILVFGFFGGSWLLSLVAPGVGSLLLTLGGLGLVYCMAQVYLLRSMPAWDSNRTLIRFALSAIVLGGSGLIALDSIFEMEIGSWPVVLIVAAGLAGVFWTAHTDLDPAQQAALGFRRLLVGLGLAGMMAMKVIPNPVGRWMMIAIFLLVLSEEGIGRWLFYEHLQRREL